MQQLEERIKSSNGLAVFLKRKEQGGRQGEGFRPYPGSSGLLLQARGKNISRLMIVKEITMEI
jgi:hypothetical protein